MADKAILLDEMLLFHCPGCESDHQVPVEGERKWGWNGSLSVPTITPSIKVEWTYGERHEPKCCHSIVTDGKIAFCSDCTHKLMGQTVDLPDYEGW